MKIVSIKALRGPNYWSVKNPQLIVMELPQGELEKITKDAITGFRERVETQLFSILQSGAAFTNAIPTAEWLKENTCIKNVIEQIALQIQLAAGASCDADWLAKMDRHAPDHVVFPYHIEAAGIYAARAAVSITDALLKGEDYDLQKDLKELRWLIEDSKFGPSTGSIVAEAKRRDIPVVRLDDDAYVQFGYGAKLQKIEASVAGTTSAIGGGAGRR